MRRFLSIDGFHGGLLAVVRILIFSSIIILTACKAQRMMDTSHRSRPDWVYGVQRGFLIGNGTGRDINEARASALNNIKSQIAQAVFSEIQSRKQFNISEVQRGKAFELITSFLSETISTTNHGIVTRGVSLSDANDYYYEVVRDRETRRETVRYSVKYPFSRMEMESYLREWDRRQQRLVEHKNEIAARVGNHESIEQIINDIRQLVSIKELIVDEHSVAIDLLISDMYNYLSCVQVKIFEEGNDFLFFGLVCRDNELRSGMRPQVTAEGVIVETVLQERDKWKINFKETGHKGPDFNSPKIRITFSYRTWKLDHVHSIVPDVELSIISPIIFHSVRFSFLGTEVRGFDYIINTEVEGMGGIVIEKIIMNPVKTHRYQRRSLSPLTIDFGNGIHIDSGSTYSQVRLDTSLKRNDFSTNGENRIIVNGTLFYREVITGERKPLDFIGIELKTDW